MTPAQVDAWARTRAAGRGRHVLLTGLLAWGLPMFVLMTFVVNRRTTPAEIAGSAVLWALGGAAFGAATWAVRDREYRKAVGPGAD